MWKSHKKINVSEPMGADNFLGPPFPQSTILLLQIFYKTVVHFPMKFKSLIEHIDHFELVVEFGRNLMVVSLYESKYILKQHFAKTR